MEDNLEPFSLDEENKPHTIKIVFMVWRSLLLGGFFVATFLIVLRLRTELKMGYIDLFKVIQYTNLLLHFIIAYIVLIIAVFDLGIDTYSIQFWFIFDANVYCFIVVNKLNWLLMIVHIRNYKGVRKGESYSSVRNRIKRVELYIIIAGAIMYVINISMLVSIMILQFVCHCKPISESSVYDNIDVAGKISLVFQESLYYSKGILMIFFIILKGGLFILLTRQMRENLHFYYQRKLRDLVLLLVVGVIFLLFSLITDILDRIFNIDIRSLDSEGEKETLSHNILHIVFSTFTVFSLFFYMFYNIRNINFKRYLYDIMVGYRIDQGFWGASMFIVRGKSDKEEIRFSIFEDAEETDNSKDRDSSVHWRRTFKDTGMVNNDYKMNYEKSLDFTDEASKGKLLNNT